MAATTTCLANSVLSSKYHRPNALSLPKAKLQFLQFKKNNNNIARFTTFCSLEDKDPKHDTPIELSMDFIFILFSLIYSIILLLLLLLTIIFFAGFEAFPTVMDINQIREILPHR